jgi:hypothetical protein
MWRRSSGGLKGSSSQHWLGTWNGWRDTLHRQQLQHTDCRPNPLRPKARPRNGVHVGRFAVVGARSDGSCCIDSTRVKVRVKRDGLRVSPLPLRREHLMPEPGCPGRVECRRRRVWKTMVNRVTQVRKTFDYISGNLRRVGRKLC